MQSNKKILVVGATGLVGAAVVKHLVSAGCDIVAVSRTPPENTDGMVWMPA